MTSYGMLIYRNILKFHLVPRFHQKGTQLVPLNCFENQQHTVEELEKPPSWRQNGTELLAKKAWYLISILAMASEPVKMSELMAALNYKNQKTFRDDKLSSVRQAGSIKFTNPEKPTDPENKYRITQAGKTLLGGMV